MESLTDRLKKIKEEIKPILASTETTGYFFASNNQTTITQEAPEAKLKGKTLVN